MIDLLPKLSQFKGRLKLKYYGNLRKFCKTYQIELKPDK